MAINFLKSKVALYDKTAVVKQLEELTLRTPMVDLIKVQLS